jgi:hypothetical protein
VAVAVSSSPAAIMPSKFELLRHQRGAGARHPTRQQPGDDRFAADRLGGQHRMPVATAVQMERIDVAAHQRQRFDLGLADAAADGRRSRRPRVRRT